MLVLIGVMAGAVGLSLGPADRGDAVSREADLLTARLNRAADEALLTGAPVAFVWDRQGYRFEVPGPDGWVPHPVSLLGDPHPMAGGVDLSPGDDADGRFVVTADLLPETGQPLVVTLRGGQISDVRVQFDGVNAQRLAPAS